MASLINVDGVLQGVEIPLDHDECTVGRDASCTVVLNDPSVSSRHCVIWKEGAALIIRDLGSLNGVRVNDQEVEECQVEAGDHLEIGTVLFKVFGDEIAPRPKTGEMPKSEPEPQPVMEEDEPEESPHSKRPT